MNNSFNNAHDEQLAKYYLHQLTGRLKLLRQLQSELEESIHLRAEIKRILNILQDLSSPKGISDAATQTLKESPLNFIAQLENILNKFENNNEPLLNNPSKESFWLEIKNRLKTLLNAFKICRPFAEIETEIRRMAHILRGSGGTFGFQLISELATKIELSNEEDLSHHLQRFINYAASLVKNQVLEKATILLLDHDPDLLKYLNQQVKHQEFEILMVETIEKAWRILHHQKIDLLILALVLQDGDGRNLLNRLRLSQRLLELPVIVLSAKGFTASMECYALGADLYFEKPFDLEAFSQAISNLLSQRKRIEEATQRDFLTGLLNRSGLTTHFQEIQYLGERNKTPNTLTLLDLDFFKVVNDTYGHDMGDNVLKKLAEILQLTLRKSDIIARWGGEEFVVIMPNTDEEGATKAIGKSLKTFYAEKFHPPKGDPFQVSFSAGVTLIEEKSSFSEALTQADQRLYHAKKSGRHQIVSAKDKRLRLSLQASKTVIALIEDDPMMVELLETQFTSRFPFFAFGSGESALKNIQNIQPTLILLDLQLPGIDGFEVLRTIRKMPDLESIPIVLISSLNNYETLLKAFQAGAQDYIQKPFSLTELEMRLERYLID
jgi:two-component system, cell cycle response regulator